MALVKQSSRKVGSVSTTAGDSFQFPKDDCFYFTSGPNKLTTKYNADGTKAWTRKLGQSPDDYGYCISPLSDGTIYVAGSTKSNLYGQNNLGGISGYDAFITKFNSDGSKAWEKLLGTTSDDFGYAIIPLSDNSLYIVGRTNGNLDGTSDGMGDDIFISKYNSNGTKTWLRQFGSSGNETLRDFAITSDGSAYITGFTDGNIDGAINSGEQDIFVAKYSANGTKIWSRQFGSSGSEDAGSIAVDGEGYVYIAGTTNGNLDGQFNSGGDHSFITKFSSDGTKLWTRLLDSSADNEAHAVTVSTDGAIYIGGISRTQNGPSGFHSFLAKYNSDGVKEWEQVLGSQSNDAIFGLRMSADNTINAYRVNETSGNSQGGVFDVIVDRYIETQLDLGDIGPSSTASNKTTSLASSVSQLYLTGAGNINGTGNALNNYISGNDGNNILDGGAGNDFLVGGKGNDTYIVDSVMDRIAENANEGIDLVKSSVNWTLGANLENLTLTGTANLSGTGNELNNVITGNSGNNVLNGGLGTDTMIGGAGNDTYYVDSTGDTITDSSGTDTVISSISWTLGTSLEKLTLTGTDALTGIGNTQNNFIIGNSGNNILDGLGGTDILTGGSGADVFRFSTRPNFGASTADHITDFKGSEGDVIQISKSAFGLASNTTASLTTVSSASALTTALGSATTFVYDSSNGNLYWNQNGNKSGFGSGGIFAVLDNFTVLGTSNIALV